MVATSGSSRPDDGLARTLSASSIGSSASIAVFSALGGQPADPLLLPRPGRRRQTGRVPNDDTGQAMAFHAATKYYALHDAEPGDGRIGIGDPADRTEATWQKDWSIKPLLYKVYESLPPIGLSCRTRASLRSRRSPRPGPRGPPSRTARCSAGSAC